LPHKRCELSLSNSPAWPVKLFCQKQVVAGDTASSAADVVVMEEEASQLTPLASGRCMVALAVAVLH
jgi:hypothetical protein